MNGSGDSMTDQEAIALTQNGWTIVFQQGAILALLPIEEWLKAFTRAESIGPILDPTLYRSYTYSGKGEVIKDVLEAALVFKQAIIKAQTQVTADPRLQR